MCRSIKRLRSVEGTAGEDEIAAAARHFVRKVSGMRQPAPRNAAAFETAVAAVAAETRRLLVALPPSGAQPERPRPRPDRPTTAS
ncbi:MAG: hypothetical protein NVSMB8_06130 [Candidatus Limnocylindrales bacterium]